MSQKDHQDFLSLAITRKTKVLSYNYLYEPWTNGRKVHFVHLYNDTGLPLVYLALWKNLSELRPDILAGHLLDFNHV